MIELRAEDGCRLAREEEECEVKEREKKKTLPFHNAFPLLPIIIMLSTLSSLLRARVGSNTFYQKEEIVLERLSAEISRLEVSCAKRERGFPAFVF